VKVRSRLRRSLLLGLRPRLHLDLPCRVRSGQRLVRNSHYRTDRICRMRLTCMEYQMTTQGRINCTTLPPDETEHTNRSVCEQLKDEREWRVALEVIYGEVWDTSDLKRDFNVIGFLVPLVAVRRKDNGEEGTLEFLHHPRFYFSYRSSTNRG
ncbi:MAG TPA: hypothetical protein PLR25_03890, partial [Planctomycetaceae bacterium]|nr:hypothetical protein [Planctomycetaceae bacterium]